jgi:hypothetical protein
VKGCGTYMCVAESSSGVAVGVRSALCAVYGGGLCFFCLLYGKGCVALDGTVEEPHCIIFRRSKMHFSVPVYVTRYGVIIYVGRAVLI